MRGTPADAAARAAPGEPGGDGGRHPLLVLGAATLSITLGALPVFLLGALAFLIRDELGFGEARLGATASIYYASAALASVPAGKLADRLGARRGIALAGAGSVVAMVGIAAVARAWWQLAAFMILAGIANGVALPATNLALVRGIPDGHKGVAFGFKQSAGTIATLVAGTAVPVIGLTVGWRWAFALVAVAAVPLVVQGIARRDAHALTPPVRPGDVPSRPIVVLALAIGCAVVGGSALGAFYVESAVAHGLPPGVAGVWLAVGSALGIAARVGWGWYGDRRHTGHLLVVAGLMAGGVLGFGLLGVAPTSAALAVGTVLTFVLGWAWPGLLHFAIVRESPAAPAAASGIAGAGQFGGGIVGPIGFGALVESASYEVAWLAVSGAMLAATLFVLAARHLLRGATPPP